MHQKLVFFEVQDWERDILKNAFPEALLEIDKLSEETIENFLDLEIASTFVYSTLSADLLKKLPKLKYISTRSTGFDHIDLEYCNKNNIAVSNVPEYGSNTVAEHTFALILSLTRKIYQSVNQAKQLNFDHSQISGTDLYGKTLGIIGLGKIGLNVLRIAKGFGMKVLVTTKTEDQKLAIHFDFQYRKLDDLLAESDVVTLHLPLSNGTQHMINKNNIQKLKKGSYLINTARGGLIDTKAIIDGLNSGVLSGVALDVLEEEKELAEEAEILTPHFQKNANMETLVMDHYLISHPSVLITPHNAFNSVEALKRIDITTIENIKSFMKDEIINTVF